MAMSTSKFSIPFFLVLVRLDIFGSFFLVKKTRLSFLQTLAKKCKVLGYVEKEVSKSFLVFLKPK